MIKAFIEGHKGLDPNWPEILCDDYATYKMVSKKINLVSIFNFVANLMICYIESLH